MFGEIDAWVNQKGSLDKAEAAKPKATKHPKQGAGGWGINAQTGKQETQEDAQADSGKQLEPNTLTQQVETTNGPT